MFWSLLARRRADPDRKDQGGGHEKPRPGQHKESYISDTLKKCLLHFLMPLRLFHFGGLALSCPHSSWDASRPILPICFPCRLTSLIPIRTPACFCSICRLHSWLSWLFHTFIKKPMLMFLSDGFRRRLTTSMATFSFWPSERLSLIILSILVGTATHLVWDSVTHNTSWIYQNWSFLRISLELPVTGEIQMYKLLEYGSSAFGLVVIGVWIWHWYRTTKPSAYPVTPLFDGVQRRIFVATLPALAILAGGLRAYHAHGLHAGDSAFGPLHGKHADFSHHAFSVGIAGLRRLRAVSSSSACFLLGNLDIEFISDVLGGSGQSGNYLSIKNCGVLSSSGSVGKFRHCSDVSSRETMQSVERDGTLLMLHWRMA